ncbi:MAG: hypothetical protein KDD10_01390 [Phaeodactylibacter sp.]|nr:hypothetical protein [Phaeodactylibacter sp.]
MKKSKLLELLAKLDGHQWRSLEVFVQSPYHNTNPEAVLLLQYLHAAWQEGFEEESLEREAIYARLFPGAGFKYQHLNQLASQLLKLAENWLVWQRLERDNALLESLKAQELLQLKLDKHYRQACRAVEKAIEKAPMSSEYYHYRYKLESLEEQYFASLKQRRYDPALQTASNALDEHFALLKLRYLCEMINRRQLIPQDYRFTFTAALQEYLETKDFTGHPLLLLYYQLYLMLTDESGGAEPFYRYVSLLRQNNGRLGQEESRILLYYAINFCIGKIRSGERQYAMDLFGLYSHGVAEGTLLDNETLSPWTYKNMVRLGLNLKKYEWVEQFARDYASYLPKNKKEDALHYNLAEIFFAQKKYEEALLQLRQVAFSDIHYNLCSKVLMAKIYYEQEQWSSLEYLLNAFRVFLRRNRSISTKVKEPYVNFVSFLSALLRRLPENYGNLALKIKEKQAIDNRDWLLHQLEAC